MTDTLTTAKSLTIQTIGANSNTWGGIENTNLNLIDKALGQTLTKAIVGNTTLTSTEAQNRAYEFTGVLSANAAITFPAFQGPLTVRNKTTGGYQLILGMATGTTVTVVTDAEIFSDGTDFFVPTVIGGPAGGDLSGTFPNPTVTGTHLSAPLPIAQGGSGQSTALGAFNALAVTAASAAVPGYIKFTNGVIMQWGFTGSLGGGNSASVTFPIAFTSNVVITVSMLNDTVPIASVSSPLATGFTARTDKVTSGEVYWFAVGV